VSTRHPLRRAATRLRLLAILAGLAWLIGLHPGVPVRLLVVAIVIDALASTPTPATRTRSRSRVRDPRWGGVR
jgi:hypothetical protein